jgi:DNA polymerase
MDRALSRRYLTAMGVTPWRLRTAADAELADEPLEEPAATPQLPPPALAAVGQSGLAAAKAALGMPPSTTAPIASATPPLAAADMTAPARNSDLTTLDWSGLQEQVRDCQRCGLCETRQRTVFGVGDPQARLMLIGEAPGADEDRQGEPFVGRAGQLLTRMLAAIDFAREQVYIGNIIKCRPPRNRDPKPEEIAACRAFIERQIALIQPDLLLCLGRISAQALLQTTESVGRLRGRWHSFGANAIPLRVTYHPSYYLRAPAEKARGWEDLQCVVQHLRELSPVGTTRLTVLSDRHH